MVKKTNILSTPQSKTIKLADGIEYTMKPFNLNMMEEVEDKFEESWDELIGKMRARVLKYLLYVCLKSDHPELTEQKVGELVTAEILTDAYKVATG